MAFTDKENLMPSLLSKKLSKGEAIHSKKRHGGKIGLGMTCRCSWTVSTLLNIMSKAEEFEVHPEFKGSGEKIGFETWRIENFEPVRQDPKNFGQFYKNDAYLVLATTAVKGSNKFEYNLHFWLGKGCSQDESGSAAIRTVELDESVLGGAAVQHRETQSHESKLFLSYFKKGIQYLEGGVESGFNKVDPDAYTKRMFQVKGNKNIRVEQVNCHCGSLNQGDVFVLDDGPNIYVWVGPKSVKKEQLGGVELSQRIRDEEKGGKAKIHVIEEDWDSNDPFFKALDSKDKVIRASDNTPDDETVRKLEQETSLYSIEENKDGGNGKKWAKVTEVAQRPLKKEMLDSSYCYVLDSGYSGLYLWTGKKCSNEFKKKVWTAANEFLAERGYPDWVSITRVVDGGETSLFKQYFENWDDTTVSPEKKPNTSNIAETDYSGADGVDVAAMHKPVDKVEDWMPDDGSAKKEVWRVDNFELVPVDERAYGVFFGGDSYVIKYTYLKANKEAYIIYFWQGLYSSQEDQGTAAAKAVEKDNEVGGQAVQIRVVMNKEPKHYMKMFGGKLVIFKGGRNQGFRNFQDFDGYDESFAYMFHIRGTVEDETRAIQVVTRATSLNTNDVFIVLTRKKYFVWVGKNSGEQEQEMAKAMVAKISNKLGKPSIEKEGKEENEFWNTIGGEEKYYTGPYKKPNENLIPPRLFQCSQASGRFTVEEIVGFNQQDLEPRDVMILDTYAEIFIWVGKEATEFEKKEAMKTSYMYLQSDPTGRNETNTTIACVRQGYEPPQFTGCFHPWDANVWSQGKTFADIVAEVGKENAGITLLEDEAKKYTQTHPLDVLQRKLPPEGVDVLKKEMYLSDEDFKKVFGMDKEAYKKVPKWKQDNLKKQHGLF